ncbi:hypothetical protein H105_08336 [Trichophyton soudanense CBS 452.61]|uniref:Acyltransferase 3 domain-containing protein n=2 Tax=Trichophyton TaxID=5550 RepID=A0A178FSK2_TRIVO|nr:hypothetical protein H105_08336 [Trichophyton soudanense CBS 452.61]EZG01561.1 hypothetical protein H106_08205 [Trichophyton rubrum CBS 735.88]OAL75174.1 hypothetical protein A7D00_0772 [Trichophyton violaceum]
MSALPGNILEKQYWQEPTGEPKPSRISGALRWFLDIVRPSILTTKGRRKQMGRTSYLDGLRGFAALLVYFGHHELWAHDAVTQNPIFENAYGYKGKHHFIALPGIRTFFSGGHFAVSVFFVLSGYVLSVKALSLIQAGDYLKLGDTLASALFRRWLRLYLPVMATTFVYMTIWHMFGITAVPDPQGSYKDEVWKWYCEMKNFSFIYRTGGEPWFHYNFHAWSIPVEFKGSIVIYTALLAFSKASRNARLLCEIGLFIYFMYIADGALCAMFVAGMHLSDLDLLAESNNLPKFFYRLQPYKETFFYSLFVISMYLGGCPSHSFDVALLKESPGWNWLSYLKPQAVFDFKWFYLFWAAVFLVSSISRIRPLQSFFELRFNQYLGRVSFALYLVHGPVLWILGDRLYSAVGWVKDSHHKTIPGWVNRFPLPTNGPLGLEVGFLAPQLILLPLTLWLAEIVTKLFDGPSVKFAQWAYSRTLPPAAKAM